MIIRKDTMFDFCILHGCSIYVRRDGVTGNVYYLFTFPNGYSYQYEVINIDLAERDHELLESEMLNCVEKAYVNRDKGLVYR